MVHGEHNKSRNSGGFALIIMGALMLIIGPQEAIVPKSLSVIVWVGGIIIGSIASWGPTININAPKIISANPPLFLLLLCSPCTMIRCTLKVF